MEDFYLDKLVACTSDITSFKMCNFLLTSGKSSLNLVHLSLMYAT